MPSGGTRAGRPSHVVGPHPAGPYVVAVDVDVTHMTCAAVGLGGALLARQRRRVRRAAGARRASPGRSSRPVPELAAAGGSVRRAGVRRRERARARSIGTPAPSASRRTSAGATPRSASMLADLASPHIPVVVGNDADLAALAEHSRGIGARPRRRRLPHGPHRRRRRDHRQRRTAARLPTGTPARSGTTSSTRPGRRATAASTAASRPSSVTTRCSPSPAVPTCTPTSSAARSSKPPAPATSAPATRCAPSPVRSGQVLGSLVNSLNPELILLGGSFGEVLDVARAEVEGGARRARVQRARRAGRARASRARPRTRR